MFQQGNTTALRSSISLHLQLRYFGIIVSIRSQKRWKEAYGALFYFSSSFKTSRQSIFFSWAAVPYRDPRAMGVLSQRARGKGSQWKHRCPRSINYNNIQGIIKIQLSGTCREWINFSFVLLLLLFFYYFIKYWL